MNKPEIKAMLLEKLSGGLAPKTVGGIRSTLSTILACAIEDGLIGTNPAAGKLGAELKLSRPSKVDEDGDELVKAFDFWQREQFMSKAAEMFPRAYPVWFLMSRTGLRIGEGTGLKRTDLDMNSTNPLTHVRRSLSPVTGVPGGWRIGPPKTKRSRRSVDMSGSLRDLLRKHEIAMKAETLRRGWSEVPEWVFVSQRGTPLIRTDTQKDFLKVLVAAGLPLHFTQEHLRHTFASLHIQRGVDLQYVSEQLGHSSQALTMREYGRWMPQKRKGAADAQDVPPETTAAEPSQGSEPGAATVASPSEGPSQA